jgi:hypothetical protein
MKCDCLVFFIFWNLFRALISSISLKKLVQKSYWHDCQHKTGRISFFWEEGVAYHEAFEVDDHVPARRFVPLVENCLGLQVYTLNTICW